MKYALFLSLILLSATASAICRKPLSVYLASDPGQLPLAWLEYQDCRAQERADREHEQREDQHRELMEAVRNLEDAVHEEGDSQRTQIKPKKPPAVRPTGKVQQTKPAP